MLAIWVGDRRGSKGSGQVGVAGHQSKQHLRGKGGSMTPRMNRALGVGKGLVQ